MLNKIKFTYKEADEQKNLFTPCHTLFKCKIKVDGLQFTFPFQCNTAYAEPNLKECMECILSDMFAYDDSCDLLDFVNEYGYETETGARQAYKSCKRTSKALHRLFTDEEIEQIEKELEEE